jgi:hypothetical protein
LPKTADQVVKEIFAKGVAEPDLEKIAAALEQIWEDGKWTDDSINRAIAGLRDEQ